MTTRLLTIRQAAEALTVSVLTVRREIDRGALPTVRVGERGVRITDDDLRAYLAARRSTAASTSNAAA